MWGLTLTLACGILVCSLGLTWILVMFGGGEDDA